MTLTDPIGDMFARIRNGQMRSLNSVEIPSSNFRQNILKILKNEGYIKDYYIEKSENNKQSLNKIKIKSINMIKKHLKPTKENKGGIISKENFIDLSNVQNLDQNKKNIKKADKKWYQDLKLHIKMK